MIVPASTLGPTAYWYLTRATGIVALILLTAVVALGVHGPLRVSLGARWPRFAVDSLHRDLSLLAVAVIVLHVVTTVADGFAPIGFIDAVIPFHSAYRPLWLGLGAVAFDLILALVATSLLRRRLGYPAWRLVHWLAYACWPVTVLHGLGTGSDSREAWALLITFACVVLVALAVAARVTRAVAPQWRPSALAATVLTPILLAVFALLGPLAPHWSKRSGTPARLLAALAPRAVTPSRPVAPAVSLDRPFTDRLSGTLSQTSEPDGAILDLELQLRGQLAGALRIRLGGQPTGGGGLSLSGSQVDLVPTGYPAALQGKVTALDGDRVTARVSAGRRSVELHASLNIDAQTGSVTGELEGDALR